MIVTYTSTTRGDILDRNPSGYPKHYQAAAVAPGAVALQDTYTIPANKRFYLTSLEIMLLRVTAAAPVGLAELYYSLTLSGNIGHVLNLYELNNTVGNLTIVTLAPQLYLYAADTINLYFGDASTGGTHDLKGAFSGILFDA